METIELVLHYNWCFRNDNIFMHIDLSVFYIAIICNLLNHSLWIQG